MRDCPVFYRPEMSVNTESYSKSSSKPKRVVEKWLANREIKPSDVISFEPATAIDLHTAHSAEYVDGVLTRRRPNGFGNRDAAVADSLMFTVGSMVAAASHVGQHGGFACSPSSGFHHAHFQSAHGFCTFNGLMVAAIRLKQMGLKVGILDCDAHEGDGTTHILHELGIRDIKHHTFGRTFPGPKKPKHGQAIAWTEDAIEDLKDCDVVLYQAGADPYVNDPLGGQMSIKEMCIRDLFVFSRLKNVAWNFAGGYSPATAQIHTNTLKAAQGRLG